MGNNKLNRLSLRTIEHYIYIVIYYEQQQQCLERETFILLLPNDMAATAILDGSLTSLLHTAATKHQSQEIAALHTCRMLRSSYLH